jgi:LacI family transcriptional regulator, galactose operon repressor
MKQYSTLKKLSEKLGLSVSTVSRALKDHPDISPATKKRVKELAELMEYEPNNDAIRLRTNKSKLLGVIVPHIQNLFYEHFLASLEEEASKMGYSVLILQSGEKNVEKESKNLDIMKRNRVDGLFVSVTEQTEDIKPFLKLTEMGIPLIFFDRVPPAETFNKICFADNNAATIAATQLIKHKKKHVLGLFWGSPKLSITQKRFTSFEEAFKNNSPETILDIHFHMDVNEAENITRKAIESNNPPDAIFCTGDSTMISAIRAIQKKGLKIPGDIGVIAISNGFIPELYTPSISYVETSGHKLAKLAYTRLMEIFDGKTFTRELSVDAVFVEGGSL